MVGHIVLLGVLGFDGPWFIGGATARRVGPADGTYGFVEPDNAAARSLYEASNFRIVEERASDLLMVWRPKGR